MKQLFFQTKFLCLDYHLKRIRFITSSNNYENTILIFILILYFTILKPKDEQRQFKQKQIRDTLFMNYTLNIISSVTGSRPLRVQKYFKTRSPYRVNTHKPYTHTRTQYTNTYVYVRTYACIYTHMYKHTYVLDIYLTHVFMYVRMKIHMYMYILTYV